MIIFLLLVLIAAGAIFTYREYDDRNITIAYIVISVLLSVFIILLSK